MDVSIEYICFQPCRLSIIIGWNVLADDPRKWDEVDYLASDAAGNPKSNTHIPTYYRSCNDYTNYTIFHTNAKRVRELIDNLELKHKTGKGYHNKLENDKFYPKMIYNYNQDEMPCHNW